MGIELNHTIVRARDKAGSAEFLAGILGLPVGAPNGSFVPVELSNGVTLDFANADDVRPQHYAFLVDEAEFDPIFARIRAAGIRYYADPGRQQRDEINHRWGGRGVYFDDPDGHLMEVLTRVG